MTSRPNAGPPGFTLVEVIVAMAVFVTGSMCMITATHADNGAQRNQPHAADCDVRWPGGD